MIGVGSIVAGGVPLAEFANGLSHIVQRPVIDRTGLAGNFDAEMTFAPDGPPGNLTPGIVQTTNPDAPSLSTAVQEQLGLKLEAARSPVEVLVIDSLARPTPD